MYDIVIALKASLEDCVVCYFDGAAAAVTALVCTYSSGADQCRTNVFRY